RKESDDDSAITQLADVRIPIVELVIVYGHRFGPCLTLVRRSDHTYSPGIGVSIVGICDMSIPGIKYDQDIAILQFYSIRKCLVVSCVSPFGNNLVIGCVSLKDIRGKIEVFGRQGRNVLCVTIEYKMLD